jgi:adenylate kinase family enzyme
MSYYIIIRGPLGCGKSTISERLSKILSAKHISIDRVVDKLPKKMEEGFISQNNFLKANELAVVEAKRFLDKGKPVIFDGNFYWKSQIDDLIKRLDYPHYVFTLKAPLDVCIERDMKRGKTHGKDAAEVVYKKSTEFSYGVVIDTTKQLNECIKDIVSNLPSSASASLYPGSNVID